MTIFLVFTLLGFSGSLSLLMPNVIWNDITYFFRKRPQEYLVFSNKIIGRFWLTIGICSFLLLIFSFKNKVNISDNVLCYIYFSLLAITYVYVQIKWYLLNRVWIKKFLDRKYILSRNFFRKLIILMSIGCFMGFVLQCTKIFHQSFWVRRLIFVACCW